MLTDLRAAWHRRQAFHADQETDCYRVFHGFTEGASGVTIDRYGSAAIINHKAPLPVAASKIAECLLEFFPFELIVLKSHQSLMGPEAGKVRVLHGEPGDGLLKVQEKGRFYVADTMNLHSNGLFLDARALRAWLAQPHPERCEGRRILNLFAHTGSLGIAARIGGAREVVHLDKSADALAKVKHSYEWNGLPPDSRGLLRGDLYHHLPRAIKWGQRFDGIILDPPPKVPPPPHAPKHRPAGQDFATLIELCCKLLAPGAWLAALCHDFRTTRAAFEGQITAASDGRLVPFYRCESGDDFPEPDVERRTRITVFTYQ